MKKNTDYKRRIVLQFTFECTKGKQFISLRVFPLIQNGLTKTWCPSPIDSPWPSALARSTATPEVTGSNPTCGGISEINLSSRYSLWHGGTLNGLCGISGIYATCYVRGDNW
jgi:hypothetical protein